MNAETEIKQLLPREGRIGVTDLTSLKGTGKCAAATDSKTSAHCLTTHHPEQMHQA